MMRRVGGSLSGWSAAVGAFVFYVWTLAPGIESWDTGELQTDANVLFVAHPTGFPLFLLGGWLFSHVFAFGDPAWRISLFSALAVAVAAAMLALFVYELTASVLASSAAGLVFAPIGIVWKTAVRADVHDLALAIVASALLFSLRAGMRGDRRALGYMALLWGAALATHPVALFAFPALLACAWPLLVRVSYGEIAKLACLCAAPLVLYAYVPICSAIIEARGLDPSVALGLHGSALVDDGAPATPAAFARYIVASRFAPSAAFASLASGPGLHAAFALVRSIAYDQYGLLALAIAIVGIGALAVRLRHVALGLVCLVVGGIGFASNYAPESQPDRYALVALWAASVALGYGAWWLAYAIVQRPRWIGASAAALLVATAVPTFGRAQRIVELRQQLSDARSEARDVANVTADGSVVVAGWTFATPLAYAKYVTKTFGSRYVVSAWPPELADRYPAWRERYGHVYFIVDGHDPRNWYGTVRWTAPRRSYVISEYTP
jgi:hypothetical protein